MLSVGKHHEPDAQPAEWPTPAGHAADPVERGYTCHAEGSVLVSFGGTKVTCTASISAGVPGFLRKGEVGSQRNMECCPDQPGRAWTVKRRAANKAAGRWKYSACGRSLRAALDLSLLGSAR